MGKIVELIKAKGGKVTREPGPVKGGKTVIAFIEDPDGYKFELLERGPTPEPLCQVMLRVGDLGRSIKFYEKVSPLRCQTLLPNDKCFILYMFFLFYQNALLYSDHMCLLSLQAFGMELLRTRDNPEYKVTCYASLILFLLAVNFPFCIYGFLYSGFTCKTYYYCLFDWFGLVFCINLLTMNGYLQYKIAMMGYGPEDKTAVLELTYNYGVTEYDKGNAYAQVR